MNQYDNDDKEEQSGINAVVASVLVKCGVLDSKEFGDESRERWGLGFDGGCCGA